jgi:hypothetical protein
MEAVMALSTVGRLGTLFFLCLVAACNAAPAPAPAGGDARTSRVKAGELDPALDYQAARSNPVTCEVDFRAIVTAPYHTRTLRVWLPIPPSDAAQQVSGSQFSTFPMEVKPTLHTEPVYGNTFAYFEFDHPQGAQIIQHKFTITTYELNWNVDPTKVQAVANWPASFGPYLRNEEQAVVIDDRVKSIATSIVPTPLNAAADMTSLLRWVNTNMKYDHVNASLAASSQHAVTQMAGHCSDYHGLCSSLGRALGYPTRVTYGINTFPKNSPSHCKMEAFIPPYGWVSFDASETQKLIASIGRDGKLDAATKAKLVQAAHDRLARGFRDNTWYLQTRGSDYDLAPKAAKRAAVVRTIYAEADGVALKEPDPANIKQSAFSWMTSHSYKADRKAPYPFKDTATLEAWVK